ncbi:MAG TPA: aspartate/glutamate racemase family protein [Wenzhouxiangellaceae bacterium]|nr:aspartate/glutamate racemase family protein [Wenzhouxiangellaceae bacterium]
MKTIGLIGGMSWESTVPYYRRINQRVAERLGGLHSARIIMHSVDFFEIERLQAAGDWDRAGDLLAAIARSLELAGADILVLCTNTMHVVADRIREAAGIPFLHIADATAEAVATAGMTSVGLLGTRFTMERDFYRGRLAKKHGIRVLVPSEPDREIVHRVIFDELCRGDFRRESRAEYVRIIDDLAANGAEAAILGCTEIGLLVRPEDVSVRLFDTAVIHAEAAARFALAEN